MKNIRINELIERAKGLPLFKIAIIASFFLLFNLLYPYKKYKRITLKEGDIALEDVIAPFTFPILKTEEELEEEKKKVRESVMPVVIRESAKVKQIKKVMNAFFTEVKRIKNKNIELQEKLKELGEMNPLISETTYKKLLSIRGASIEKEFLKLASAIIKKGVIADETQILQRGGMILLVGEKETFIRPGDILDLKEIAEEIRRSKFKYSGEEDIMEVMVELAIFFIEPFLSIDTEKTKLGEEVQVAKVSEKKGTVLKGEMIAEAHYSVTKGAWEKIISLEFEKDRRGIKRRYSAGLSILGRNFLFSLLLLFLFFYLYSYKRAVFRNDLSLLLIAVLFFISLGFGYLVLSIKWLPNYAIPVAIASLALALLLDTEIAIAVTLTLSLAIGIYTGLRFPEFLIALLTGITGAFSVRKLRRRAQFYESILFIFAVYLIGITSIELLRLSELKEIIRNVEFGGLTSVFSVFFVMGILPVFERFFGVTTDLTLLEISDLNRPLLKRLSMEAPGTFHHSIVIGSLAEAAAEGIGANSLLARVGAYYHDIGKLKKPEYYADNQIGIKNPHDKLSPKMSALIVISHAKDGIEIAKKNRLPKPVIDIIKEHHGKTLIVPFYQKAIATNPKGKVSEHDFRYTGPRPHSKESAIVMLADAVEATCRSLENPTPSRLKGAIRQVINNRFNDFELDEAGLTMRDLHKIGESFLPIILGVYHQRPEYPERTGSPVQ